MRRLGAALVEHIRKMEAAAKFVIVEAAPPSLAAGIAEHWETDDQRLPRLAIAADDPSPYGSYALGAESAAALRHGDPSRPGLCLVVVEGYELAERQSLRSFVPVAPSDLLESKNALMLLADAVQPIRRDGPIAAVREAIVTLSSGERPSAARVSAYFDEIARGRDPMDALPVLGGFQDPGQAAGEVRSERVKENLALAASRRSETVVRPAVYADIRARSLRVLGRRGGDADQLADQFMSLLQSGSDDLLSFLSFDDAREILTAGQKGLPAQLRQELADYRRELQRSDPGSAAAIPWDDYRNSADALERANERKDAARSLLSFDLSEGEAVFLAATRRKLQALLRDRSISATPGSAPEVGIAKAIRSLGHVPTRVLLADPHPAVPPASQSAARDWLALAAARVRLGGVFRKLEASNACDVDGLLVVQPFDGLDEDEARGLFTEAGLDGGSLPSVRLKLYGPSGSVEVTWAPDIDDIVLLRCLVAFAERSALSLSGPSSPDPLSVARAAVLEPADVPDAARQLGMALQQLAHDTLRDGLRPERLRAWSDVWTEAVEQSRGFRGRRAAEAAALAGCVEGAGEGRNRSVGMSALAPAKAEWLAAYLEAGRTLIESSLEAVAEGDETVLSAMSFDVCSQAVTKITASHYPPFIRLPAIDEPLLPSRETRIWTVFGGPSGILNFETHALDAVDGVLVRLLRLQPEAAGHLRCLAIGPGAGDLMLREAIQLVGRKVGGVEIERIEVFLVDTDEPAAATFAAADAHRATGDSAGVIELRYLRDLDDAAEVFGSTRPAVHFALLTGLTANGGHPAVNTVEVEVPELDDEALFAPRVGQRPETEQRILLMPPGPTATVLAWVRLAQAIDDRWPQNSSRVAAPEMRTGAAGVAERLRAVHDLAMWVATVDRYATRDSLERALEDEVAILHQEQRLGSESPIGLVVSQKAGGPVDRAVGRSLRQARIVDDEGAATSLGSDLRRVASEGYGILALEAATSGTGINELVGHVVGFSLLGKTSTPWPLPPGCRVILVSLDEHADWFIGQKRADLLALAIDVEESGLHGAVIEVKARRSDEEKAGAEALDQLKKTLLATAFAAYPRPDDLATRVWMNRIAEAVYAVARESRIRLSADELLAIEAFRRGRSTLEWAGLGLVFGPGLEDRRRVHRQVVDSDWVPIAMHDVRLTEQRLRDAVATDLRELYTAEAEATPLSGGRRRRRPEVGVPRPERRPAEDTHEPADETPTAEPATTSVEERPVDSTASAGEAQAFAPPVLGWDQYTGDPLLWKFAGEGALSNGHVQIWGSSGAGKTQFVKMLLAQLALGSGTRFGIADFKNDYGPGASEDFPTSVGAEFIDLWGRPGAPYNPLALETLDDQRGVDAQVIEFRDCIEQAMASFQRIGTRQKASVERALRDAYRSAVAEQRWPTMLDLNAQVGDDLAHILGDLTRYEIFTDGPPLATVVDQNVVFGLSRIPGNGQTTVLSAAFILSVIALAIQDRPPVANTVSYAMVVDEAHRVAQFKALHLMLREGRSKGLAVVVATQAPSDLPEVVDTNAQTRICFRLSDAVIAGQAARKMDPADESLAERIRTLGTGEAFVSLEGSQPRLVTMAQHHRDRQRLDAGQIDTPPSG